MQLACRVWFDRIPRQSEDVLEFSSNYGGILNQCLTFFKHTLTMSVLIFTQHSNTEFNWAPNHPLPMVSMVAPSWDYLIGC